MPFGLRKNLPSYIPAGQFATALIDLVARGGVTPPTYAQTGAPPSGLAASVPLTVATLREAAASFPNERIKRAVIVALDNAQGDLAAVKKNIEDWFNGSMDRVSGWYKRRTQKILFVIGFAAAAVLNIDALTVAQRLSHDELLRKAAVAQAERITAPAAAQSTPPASAAATATAPNAAAVAPGIPADLARKNVRELNGMLKNIGYPIGWENWKPKEAPLACTQGRLCWQEIYAPAVLKMLLGWLITALAVMLGAPFWFDVLSKFMVVRSTMKPRPKSPEEVSEDRAGAAPPAPRGSPPPPKAQKPKVAFEPHEWSSGAPDRGVI
jgi:hypothetical protein